MSKIPAEDLVFIDETGSNIALTPLYARAPKGERARGKVPRNRGKNTTLIAALSLSGMGAAMILEGSTNTITFEVYVEQVLAPTLQAGQIVVMDNLQADKSARIKQVIERKHRGWAYQQDDRAADLNVRVFLEHDVAVVGVRLAKAALHDRWYQRVHLPGALKPSVAAALVLLAQTTSTTGVLDPCCGCGTILIEAALRGASVCGGDRSSRAVAAARMNGAAAGVKASVHQWNTTAHPIATATMDRVITNLPWGRQVPVDETLPSLYERIFAQLRRVLTPSGRLVVLTNAPEKIDPLDLSCVEQIEISLFGQRPTILIYSAAHACR